jgi:hypothetical protein
LCYNIISKKKGDKIMNRTEAIKKGLEFGGT